MDISIILRDILLFGKKTLVRDKLETFILGGGEYTSLLCALGTRYTYDCNTDTYGLTVPWYNDATPTVSQLSVRLSSFSSDDTAVLTLTLLPEESESYMSTTLPSKYSLLRTSYDEYKTLYEGETINGGSFDVEQEASLACWAHFYGAAQARYNGDVTYFEHTIQAILCDDHKRHVCCLPRDLNVEAVLHGNCEGHKPILFKDMHKLGNTARCAYCLEYLLSEDIYKEFMGEAPTIAGKSVPYCEGYKAGQQQLAVQHRMDLYSYTRYRRGYLYAHGKQFKDGYIQAQKDAVNYART